MASPKNPNSNGTQPQPQTPTPAPPAQQPPAPPPAPARAFQKIVYRDRPAAPPAAEARQDDGEYDPVVDDSDPGDETPAAPQGAVKPHPKQAAPAEPEEDDAPQHSPRILRLARELGFGDHDVSLLSPDELEAEVTEAARQIARDRRAASANEAMRQQPQPQAPAEPEVDPYDIDLADDEYDPKIVSNVKKLRDHIKAQAEELKELKQQIGRIGQIEGRRQAESNDQMIDRVFDSLGAADHFGEGRPAPGTREMARRQAVLGYVVNQLKDHRGTPEQKMREAAETLFGVNPPAAPAPARRTAPTPARDAATGKWREAATIAPTRRAPEKSAKGIAAARRTFMNGMRDQGMESAATGDDENDELPE